MSLAKKIAYNTLMQVIGKIGSTVLGLFSLALITRHLGPEVFGEYTTVITFLGFFAIFADFGLTLITVQLLSDKKRNESKVLNNLFAFRLISIVIFLSLAPLSSIFLPYSPAIKSGIIIALFAFIFPALNQIIIGLFQKKLCMEKSAISEIVAKAVLLLGIIISTKLQLGLNGILFATVLAAFISFILHYLFSLKFAVISLAWDMSLWKEVIVRFWPLAITVILNLIYLKADILLLSFFKSSTEVGFYGASYKIIDVLSSIPFMFAGLILPILSTAWMDNEIETFKKILQKSLDFMIIATLPIIIGTQFIAKETMFLVAGSEFTASSIILQILIISLLAIFPGTILAHAVISIDKQKKMIPFYLFTTITSLMAYLILIPRYSYFGAAAVSIYSELSIAIFSAYCLLKYSGFRINLKKASLALLSSLIMGGFLYCAKLSKILDFNSNNLIKTTKLLVLILISAIIYFTVLILFKVIKKEDILTIIKKQRDGSGQAFGPGNNL